MLQVLYMDVAYIASVLDEYCKCLFKMFSISDVCCKQFDLDIVYVSRICCKSRLQMFYFFSLILQQVFLCSKLQVF
jgi:hypothetical protein